MPTRALQRSVVLALFSCVCASFGVSAQEHPRPSPEHSDEWSDPNPGVRYLHRTTTTPSSIHALVIDLTHPGVRIRATPYAERWQTVSEYATQHHLAAAMNGGFWGMFQRAQGVTAGGGSRWPDGSDDEEVGFFAVTRDGTAWISPCERVEDNIAAPRLSEAVSGQPMLVRNGHMDSEALDAFDGSNRRHPRSAAGVSRDGHTVILIVADGRQGFSHGMTLYELSRMFVELGAYTALNLDGGGSSAMFVDAEGGIVNSPSGGRWEARLGLGATNETHVAPPQVAPLPGPKPPPNSHVRLNDDGVEEVFVRGNEREVMNHIGVIAPAHGSETIDGGVLLLTDAGPHSNVVIETPRPPAMPIGRFREVLFPLAYALVIITPVALAIWLLLRRRKRSR
ncbi:MAG: phosphodiester glycosidase family protein [Sandaracinaceae bacterium]|nr:phosphodiester glycosidase family protein [Sandaracinaceae bacterium]